MDLRLVAEICRVIDYTKYAVCKIVSFSILLTPVICLEDSNFFDRALRTLNMIGTYGEPDELLSRLSREKVEPLWTVMHSMVKPQPAPKAEVSLWKYEQLRPLLLQAGKQVSSDEAERRVLMLVNPALSMSIKCHHHSHN